MTDRKTNPTPATTGTHALFTLWARKHGIEFPKLIPAYLPPAGLGIIATEEIRGPDQIPHEKANSMSPGEVIAFTPSALLLTRENIEQFSPGCGLGSLLRQKKDDGGLSSHAVLAAVIAREMRRIAEGHENMWREWIDVWPKAKEFRGSMPLMWSAEEINLLPPSTKRLLDEQREKFKRDFKTVEKKGFGFTKQEYMWAWIIGFSWKITRHADSCALVNTRTLFYKPPHPAYNDLPREDCMALCPFIDYFNHSDDGCSVQLTPTGFTVTPTKPSYPANAQLFVTYGCHSNDFLLVEYGFNLPLEKNKWDEVSITPNLLPLLSEEHKRVLSREGFLGKYAFDKEAFCFRTQVAVRLMLIEHPEMDANWRKVEAWKNFLSGHDDGERERYMVEESLLGFLDALEEEGKYALLEADKLREQGIRGVIKMRWEQILGMANDVRTNMVGENGERRGRRYAM
ncbi:SET domain-containing protein [Tuber magnatum]|uniref:SET domain-containing protein n=1 Tax=Tuber magnatum TaxID=42249 RepID=A0A317SF18_9PEZI|nr:SET domain-containing protein [Tuber magnatum]